MHQRPLLFQDAPVAARASIFLECAYFVNQCSQGNWPSWMQTYANLSAQHGAHKRAVIQQRTAAALFYRWAEVAIHRYVIVIRACFYLLRPCIFLFISFYLWDLIFCFCCCLFVLTCSTNSSELIEDLNLDLLYMRRVTNNVAGWKLFYQNCWDRNQTLATGLGKQYSTSWASLSPALSFCLVNWFDMALFDMILFLAKNFSRSLRMELLEE